MVGIALTILLICWTNLSLVVLAVNAPSISPTIFTRRPTFSIEPTVRPTNRPTLDDPNAQFGAVVGGVFGGMLGFVGVGLCTIFAFLYHTKEGARIRLRPLLRKERILNAKMRRLEEQINSGRSSFFSSAQARQLRYDGYVNQLEVIQSKIQDINRKFFPEESRAAGTPNAHTPPSFALRPAVQVRESIPYANVVTTRAIW